MSKRPHRNQTPAFKAEVALAAIKGNGTLAQLAEHFDVQAPTIEGSCDFLGVNGWKREWQNRIIGHGGRGDSRFEVMALASQPNPTPYQRFTSCSQPLQAPSGE